jgi:thiamine-phosphate pyrophosphorylase
MPALPTPELSLIYINDHTLSQSEQIALVRKVVEVGEVSILVRDPEATAAALYDLALQLRPVTKANKSKLLISDRVDVALAVGADGVHLGRRSLPGAIVRKMLGKSMLLGFSAHSVDEILKSHEAGIDYCTISPVFRPTSKPNDTRSTLGLQKLQQLSEESPLPLVALGGIESSNAASCFLAGAQGIAVSGAISRVDAPDPVISQLKKITQRIAQ